MLPTRISVCTAPGLSMTTTRRVGGGGSTGFGAVGFGRAPLAERALGAGERLLGRDVADDREDGVVGAEPGLVERDEIVARDARDRLRRARVRPAVRMEAVDEPVEHHAGEVVRIVVADLQPRQDLLALPLDLLRRERGLRARSDTRSSPKARLSFITTALMKVRSLPAPVPSAPPIESIGVGDLLGVLRRRALIEQRRDERRDARLVRRVLRAAGADDQPQADRRLLVVRDRDDLQAVGQRPDLVGRKLDVARRPAAAAAAPTASP